MRPAAASIALLVCARSGAGADWPTYRGDAARSAYTADALPAKLSLAWTYEARHAPMPAWPRDDRLPLDRAYQPIVAGGTLYFGSSADCTVYALDAATGRPKWSYVTDGPIRYAPVAWKDRVFVASDDGHLYCLSAADGNVLWKKRGGPNGRMILGNGRMISRWPARGGPVVVDDVVYFGAGIWPTEGIYLYALDAATGNVRWCNDQAGYLVMDQPHPTAVARSGVSAQGYLVVAGDKLIVPTGRAVPAVFDHATGKLLYFHLQPYTRLGGAPTAVIDDYLFNNECVYRLMDGLPPFKEDKVPFKGGRMPFRGIHAVSVAAAPGVFLCDKRKALCGIDRAKVFVPKEQKRGKKVKVVWVPNEQWTIELPGGPLLATVVAGKTAVCADQKNVVTVDLDSKRIVSSLPVKGVPYGLAVADGRLYVSTDRGEIRCFSAESVGQPAVVRDEAGKDTGVQTGELAAAADEIVRTSGVTEGYCVDLGCGDGQLATELARRTKLKICAVDASPRNVKAARARLIAAGLYGVRVTVHQADPAKTDYPMSFADLVVSARSVKEGQGCVNKGEMMRLVRPYGGVVCVGKVGAMEPIVRGPVNGAGEWTHQYCNPANTTCSSDAIAKGPLEVLWFDTPEIQTPNRHGRGPAPLFMGGRIFTVGVDKISAVNAYNGRLLWSYPVPGFAKPYHQEHLMGVAGTNSSYCAANDSIYVGHGMKCIRIDAATGKKLAEFPTPPAPDGKPGRWGYIACTGDLLFGTLANQEHLVPYRFGKSDMTTQFTESIMLFAMDAKTGELTWTRRAEKSIRNNAIAIGGGRVYLIDRVLAWEPPRDSKQTKPQPTGTLLALDARTGKEVWRNNDDVYGTLLALSVAHDALLMSYQPTRFRLGSEFGGKFRVYRASTGEPVWERRENYESRPLINDRTIYAQPGAWDLLTGEPKRWTNPETGEPERWRLQRRSYGCGIISASCNLLLFRSATIGYIDLLRSNTTENYGGIRPGCWINLIPAGGLVLSPDSTNICQCSYLNKATIALKAME